MQVDWDVNAVVVKTRHGLADLEAKTQKRTRTTGCGQGTVFGDLMDEIDNVRLPADATLTRATLYALLDRVRVHETIYKQAGAVHGCALATNDPATAPGTSEILMFVEDVGRHNAVDAIAGQMWLDRIDGGDKIFYTTGRLTSEMVIKAAQMGIPFLVSRSGPDADGLRDRAEGRHHDDRPRDEQALSAVHRRRAVPRRRDGESDSRTMPMTAGRRTLATEARGRCMCGRVRFVARFPSRFCAHCHCESCRRSHSAGFVTWIGFLSPQVAIESGGDDLAAYESSPDTQRIVLPRLRHQALLRVREMARRDARRARGVRRSGRSRAGGRRVLRRARRVDRAPARRRAVTRAAGRPRAASPASCSPAGRAGAWAAWTRAWSTSPASRWSRTCSTASRRRSTTC